MNTMSCHILNRIKSLVFIVLSLTLVSCGGGGGGASGIASLVATFIDAPVSGLEFQSASGGGITDANGNFTYKPGESVTFKIGNMTLGTATPSNGTVTPLSLVGTSSSSDPRVVRILQTLQSLDTNNGTGSTIQISSSSRDALRTQPSINLSDSATSTAVVISALQAHDNMVSGTPATSGNTFRVSSTDAQNHFEQYRNSESNASSGYTPPPTSSSSGSSSSGSGSSSGGTSTSGSYTLVAWNDLGMHCFDGKDFSIFSILPPFNNLHAQLIDNVATTGKLITTGVTITYESVADAAGLITTTSSNKTNFWTYANQLFSFLAYANPLPIDIGLTGSYTPSLTPHNLAYNSTNSWWEAVGIPVVPYTDADPTGATAKNFYPMVKVVARNSAGTILASTSTVLPVSDEISCVSCHASGSNSAAQPTAGWVNNTDPLKDWKLNILRLHDQKFPNAIAQANAALTTPLNLTGNTMEGSALAGKPVLCASCHYSNALGTPQVGSIPQFTTSMHSAHANVSLPGSSVTLNNDTTRAACYNCHPGSVTKCLRGVMGNAINPTTGAPLIDCQSCHGPMSSVGSISRMGWLDEPACQNCHDRPSAGSDFQRYTSVFSSGTTVRTNVDTLFATQANRPMTGKALYRFSAGHGGLQCEACHGATHAEYPSSHPNDNVQSQALQGHVGTIAECTVCHQTVPSTTNGGPHGLHTVGQAWISQHPSAARSNLSYCATCHGTAYQGTPLSKTSTARTFSVEGGTKTFSAGQQIGCYSCHNGPNGG